MVSVLLATFAQARPAQAQPAPASADCDRAAVVMAWRNGGSQVRAAAEQALLGADADVCALATGWAARYAGLGDRVPG